MQQLQAVREAVSEADLPARPDVSLRCARILKLLGFEMDGVEVERILTGLGLGVAIFPIGVLTPRTG